MMTIREDHFADFTAIPREQYRKALRILNDTFIDYAKRRRRILYLMRDLAYTDDPPLMA